MLFKHIYISMIKKAMQKIKKIIMVFNTLVNLKQKPVQGKKKTKKVKNNIVSKFHNTLSDTYKTNPMNLTKLIKKFIKIISPSCWVQKAFFDTFVNLKQLTNTHPFSSITTAVQNLRPGLKLVSRVSSPENTVNTYGAKKILLQLAKNINKKILQKLTKNINKKILIKLTKNIHKIKTYFLNSNYQYCGIIFYILGRELTENEIYYVTVVGLGLLAAGTVALGCKYFSSGGGPDGGAPGGGAPGGGAPGNNFSSNFSATPYLSKVNVTSTRTEELRALAVKMAKEACGTPKNATNAIDVVNAASNIDVDTIAAAAGAAAGAVLTVIKKEKTHHETVLIVKNNLTTLMIDVKNDFAIKDVPIPVRNELNEAVWHTKESGKKLIMSLSFDNQHQPSYRENTLTALNEMQKHIRNVDRIGSEYFSAHAQAKMIELIDELHNPELIKSIYDFLDNYSKQGATDLVIQIGAIIISSV